MKAYIAIGMMVVLLLSAGAFAAGAPTWGEWEDMKEKWDDEAGDIGENCDMFGKVSLSDGVVDGRFVDCEMNDEGEVHNYTVDNGTVRIFDSITYENETKGTLWAAGAVVMYAGMGYEGAVYRYAWIHDNPSAVYHMVVYGSDTVVFDLAPGITAKKLVTSENVAISGNGITALILVGNGESRVDGDKVYVTLGESPQLGLNISQGMQVGDGEQYSFSAGMVTFVMKPLTDEVDREIEDKVFECISSGRFGGEMRVAVGEKGYAYDFVNYSREVKMRLVKAERNRINLEISAEVEGGRAFEIVVNKDSLKMDSSHTVVVKIDGKEAKQASVDEVLAATGTEAKYAVVEGKETVHVYLYIPHFSTHDVTVESVQTEAGFLGQSYLTWGIIAAAVVLGAIAVVAIKRRR